LSFSLRGLQMDENKYESTVSASKEESLLKALEIFEAEQSKKEITRPELNTKRILLVFFGWLVSYALICTAVFAIGNELRISGWISAAVVFILLLAILIPNAKKLIRNSVLLYQKYAPEKVRASCLFTPSCSEYMLLAVEKHGVIKGVSMGIKRLLRCHHPNGGIDYP